MEINIIPYVGAGSILFGASAQEIRRNINTYFDTISDDEGYRDIYFDLGLQVHYKNNDLCDAIQLSAPSIPVFNKTNFLGMPFQNVKTIMKAIDPDILIDDTGLTSLKYGINLYADLIEDLNSAVEIVLVFERGYYDEIIHLLGGKEE